MTAAQRCFSPRQRMGCAFVATVLFWRWISTYPEPEPEPTSTAGHKGRKAVEKGLHSYTGRIGLKYTFSVPDHSVSTHSNPKMLVMGSTKTVASSISRAARRGIRIDYLCLHRDIRAKLICAHHGFALLSAIHRN
ncbi:hypothetical protein [Roseinatronobacter sp.]|uniref:hypothetical protein n=1 Tax=Roseinatronobacter sp. TaxID=1945755 RepID=UPI0025DC7A59|nr:hypothetical protein [Rhodobaca sp.]